MTTTVIVQAHCNEDEQVKIEILDAGVSLREPIILQDGEEAQEVVYDGISIIVCEEARTK